MKHKVYLALGSNLGASSANLQAAIDSLAPDVHVLRQSPVYETAPWGFAEQNDFLNQVVEVETELSPEGLLAYLKHIEVQVGRTPNFRNGPRVIDIDILLFDNLVFESGNLTIPHPGLAERAFVLVPLADLNPSIIHPKLDESVGELLSKLDTSGIKTYMEP
ncbi:MAG: 2-amino-4-hydroxy-6-hydroxymethyldihydropteridine diphosphokinase [Chloroflexi bacterium]|nr:2-amino-4-hydroxy-6-hydroxymethyldihydropteridine diphosphokinase [Chloroflexota bacterium]